MSCSNILVTSFILAQFPLFCPVRCATILGLPVCGIDGYWLEHSQGRNLLNAQATLTNAHHTPTPNLNVPPTSPTRKYRFFPPISSHCSEFNPTTLSTSLEMSCNICHTPILVHPTFLNPNRMDHVSQEDHLDPIVNQVCPITSHQAYFRKVVQIDRRFEGVVMQDVQHAGRGVFISNQWKIAGGTAQAIRQEEVNNQVTVACVSASECVTLIFSIMLLMKDV